MQFYLYDDAVQLFRRGKMELDSLIAEGKIMTRSENGIVKLNKKDVDIAIVESKNKYADTNAGWFDKEDFFDD